MQESCEICGHQLTKKQIARGVKYCRRECYYKSRVGHDVSKATRAAIAATKLGKPRPREMVDRVAIKIHENYVTGKTIHWQQGKPRSEAQKKQQSETMKRKYASGEIIHHQLGKTPPKAILEKLRTSHVGVEVSYATRLKMTETRVGGFWYGNVRYPENGKTYCEKWTEDLRERIRAAWDYKSAISGVTTDSKGRKLDCHHVYEQEKACCIWDGDVQGYYAMINLGTKRNPNFVRYNISGDPNKFVPLTRAEHKATSFDKLKWIKFFEDLIEARGGKCYLTQEEVTRPLSSSTPSSV